MKVFVTTGFVLIDEIDLNKSQGSSPYVSVIDAGVSRVRPVALAALKTGLGVVPLLQGDLVSVPFVTNRLPAADSYEACGRVAQISVAGLYVVFAYRHRPGEGRFLKESVGIQTRGGIRPNERT